MKFELVLDRISQEDVARGSQPEVVTIPIKVDNRMMKRSPDHTPRALAYFEARRIRRQNYVGWNLVGLIDDTGYRITWEDCHVV